MFKLNFAKIIDKNGQTDNSIKYKTYLNDEKTN